MKTEHRMRFTSIALLLLVAAAPGCSKKANGGAGNAEGAGPASSVGTTSGQARAALPLSTWFDAALYAKQLEQAKVQPVGDPAAPWTQAIEPSYVDTAKYKKTAPWHVCFSNASLTNPWRTAGFATMQAEVKLHPQIAKFTAVDAGGKDEKQIADISDLLTQNCSVLIVAPNTTGPLTTIVNEACKKIPVIGFDRGVSTECPVTFIHPIGGFLFGATSAKFLTSHVPKGGKVLALRILPGVDVLEHRWAGAQHVFNEAGIHVVGMEFTGSDPAKTKQIVTDYIQRYHAIDGVWMDAGDTTAAAAEAFQDAGAEVPPITGEDNNAWLQAWQKNKWTATAPTYPVYQWRTAILAAVDILSGQKVPKEWILPQPEITRDTVGLYAASNLPPTFYAMCGCQKMPGFPALWGGK
ncbi:substrate-binding domain-containing protein [Pendulispora albinea]|uniref:Substrate-binding domain-containing protein n=1 Tax=Pendulispora albinea TaxID=2741071 RepID=A0ABZ2M8T7_9BACT